MLEDALVAFRDDKPPETMSAGFSHVSKYFHRLFSVNKILTGISLPEMCEFMFQASMDYSQLQRHQSKTRHNLNILQFRGERNHAIDIRQLQSSAHFEEC